MEVVEVLTLEDRFNNFELVFIHLQNAINENTLPHSDITKEGMLKRFEYTHVYAWKAMKEWLKSQGVKNINNAKNVSIEAYNNNLIQKLKPWLDMIDSREISFHSFKQEVLESEYKKLIEIYMPQFEDLRFQLKSYL